MNKDLNQKTIFISLASVTDTEIVPSVINAFAAAKYPERIFIGIGLLDKNKKNYKKLKNLNNDHISIKYEKFNKKLLGVGLGRARAQSLYNNQDYFLQLDAHSFFNQGWDEDLINLHKEAKEFSKSEKVILSCIPAKYSYDPDRSQLEGNKFPVYPAFRMLRFWPGGVPRWESIDLKNWGEFPNKFYPVAKASSAFMFGDQDFGKDTGIEESAVFYDEEIFYSVNLFDKGYSFIFPNVVPFPISHLFASDINRFGGHRDFWTKSLSKKEDEDMTNKMMKTFKDFINNEINREKIRKYEKYSKVSLKHGAAIDVYMPKEFNL